MTAPIETELRRQLARWADVDVPPPPDLGALGRRSRARAARHRALAVVAVAAVVVVVGAIALVGSIGGGDGRPLPAQLPSPTPSPTPSSIQKTQSPQTWVDTKVAAGEGYGWEIADPLRATRGAWFAIATEHLEPAGRSLEGPDDTVFGVEFTLPAEGSSFDTDDPAQSAHDTYGRIGLVVDPDAPDPSVGCRFFPRQTAASNGAVWCTDETVTGPRGEPGTLTRWERHCGAYEGPAVAPSTCGDYQVAVAIERRDGRTGYVLVEGRGTPDFNPFATAAMAAAAADPRLTLPDAAVAMPSDDTVASVVQDHFPSFRRDTRSWAGNHPGLAAVEGALTDRKGLMVTVQLAGADPVCGRSWLIGCVERRVYGGDDPTTVFVGAWDEEDWASCCPRNSRADSRELVYVGPRHTVLVHEGMIVREDEDPISDDLDQRLIDLVLDPRLQ
ncbi:hypothetical protein E8D34_13110 [Nocardioides sp. GY 10113]|uniref:hypothetical protein n=1 Tax=Nocardioides sp. GY 10113 TaxID=2569761 RepID=UPI0010A9456B|nr:hypothetical protein [Nocardioides sp. GY 10113]TIC85018.1 hypothetical protein E8D34_13110 [Nocardioides sp. GY 10113]